MGLGFGRIGVIEGVAVQAWARLPSTITIASGWLISSACFGTGAGGILTEGTGFGAGIWDAARVVGWGTEVEVGRTTNSLGVGTATRDSVWW